MHHSVARGKAAGQENKGGTEGTGFWQGGSGDKAVCRKGRNSLGMGSGQDLIMGGSLAHLAWCLRSSCTTSSWPCFAAPISALLPNSSTAFTLAPRSMSIRHTACIGGMRGGRECLERRARGGIRGAASAPRTISRRHTAYIGGMRGGGVCDIQANSRGAPRALP